MLILLTQDVKNVEIMLTQLHTVLVLDTVEAERLDTVDTTVNSVDITAPAASYPLPFLPLILFCGQCHQPFRIFTINWLQIPNVPTKPVTNLSDQVSAPNIWRR